MFSLYNILFHPTFSFFFCILVSFPGLHGALWKRALVNCTRVLRRDTRKEGKNLMSFPCHSLVISMRGRSSFDLNQLLLSTYTPPLTVAVFFPSVASSVGLVGVMFVWKRTAFCLHNRESICQV